MAMPMMMKPGGFNYSELAGAGGPVQHHFSPYQDNGGSIVAVAGNGFAVIASDTRLSTGYSIYTRDQPKLFPLTTSTVLGCSGCWCDVLSMTRLIDARMKLYKHEHQKDMSAGAVAQMLSTILYGRRFFPYYVSNVVAGIDADNQGVIYSYDPVGHCEKGKFHAGGSSGALLQPLLDNQIAHLNMQIKPEEPLSLAMAKGIIKDVFISAAERDIYTGDGILLKIVTKDGVVEETLKLRHD
jgi:20S proteasome subunit beta 6